MKTRGLLKLNASAAPWISDPTAANARARWTAPCTRRTESGGVGTPRLIWAVRKGSDGQGRAREFNGGACAGEMTRTAACGGDSPALPLGGAPGHQNVHKLVHYVEGAHAHVTGGLGGRSCTKRGRGGCSGELVDAPKCTR
jgi:hypothetical protein